MTRVEEEKLETFANERNFQADILKMQDVCYAEGKKLAFAFSLGEEFYEERHILADQLLIKKVPKDMHMITQHYEDYFKNDRIIIALKNVQGEIAGFAGRAVRASDKPKYLFTKGLKKSDILYRLNFVKSNYMDKKISKILYLVEGVFDVLRLETKKQYAVGVLGSHLTQKQAYVLADFMKNREEHFSVCVFMDSDEARLQGSYDTLCNLLKNAVLRHFVIKVRLIKSGEKDPDEYYQKKSITDLSGIVEYSPYEFLFRYLLKTAEDLITEIDVKQEFQKRNSEERLHILNKIRDIMPYPDWKEYLAWGSSVYGAEQITEGQLRQKVENYVLGYSAVKQDDRNEQVEYSYHMQTALQIARVSYEREDIYLDEWTWDRMQQVRIFSTTIYTIL